MPDQRRHPAPAEFSILLADAERLAAEGRGADAEKAYQAALALRPDDPAALTGYARLARRAGRPDLAAQILGGRVVHGAAELEELTSAFREWAGLLALAGEADRAARVWWMLILADPCCDVGYAGVANIRAAQGRHPQALRGWDLAVKANPVCGDWRYNQGNSLKALGRTVEADAAYRAAARCDPALALADFNRGYAALEQGRLADGWDGLEKRFAAGRAKPDRRFSCPPWDGGALDGGALLIWREQGIGDELMFASCYADALAAARKAGAGRVVIDAEPRLAGLLGRALAPVAGDFPVDVRPWRDGEGAPAETPAADIAAHLPAGSLPTLLRRRLAAFPGQPSPAAAADPALVKIWRERLAGLGPGLKIGMCWRSGLGGAARAAACARLADWGPLLTQGGTRWVNLQYDECEAELADAERRFGVAVWRPPGLDLRLDLEGTAALIAGLDLVVSTGTSVAELAGALGVATWRLCRAGEWSALGAPCRPWFPAVRPIHPPPGEELAGAAAVAAGMLARLRPARPAPPPAPPPVACVSLASAPLASGPASAPKGKPADLLTRGVALHRAGRLDDAAAHYRAVPKGKPQYPDARHLSGMVACAQERYADALADFDAAIAANGRAPDFHANRAYALLALGRHADAAAAARRALALRRDHAEAANTLGNALAAQGEWLDAAAAYEAALAVRANYAEAAANLGVALAALGRDREAAARLRLALAASPAHGPAQGAWADLRLRAGDAAGAARRYAVQLALQPANPAAWEARGRALHRLDPADDGPAAACWRRAALAAPSVPEPWAHLGAVRRRSGDGPGTARLFSVAAALEPGRAGALSNLAMARRDLGDAKDADRLFARALRLDPADGLSRFNRGLMRLADGDAGGGWADYDGRLTAPALFPPPGFDLPFWRGEPLAGRRVLAWREQGLGDELMFAALYPLLVERAAQVTIACDPRLVGLFARSFAGADVQPLPALRRRPPVGMDFQVAAGSLPGLLAPRLADSPLNGGELRPDPDLAAAARARLAALGPGLKLGFAWTSARLDPARARAYLTLDALTPLLGLPGVVPVSLQYDGRFDEIAAFSAATGIQVAAFPDVDLKDDLESAAALTASCDLVVSVASSSAEMAAALGAPVWRLGARDWTQVGTAARPTRPSMRVWNPRPGESLAATVGRAAQALRRLMDAQALRQSTKETA